MPPNENLHIDEFDLPLGWEAITESDEEGEAVSLCQNFIQAGKSARYSSRGGSFIVWVMQCPTWPPIEASFHNQSINKNQ